ncbi:MAG: hypothetical protein SNJ72_04240 [Fimbriimonadales bacterium]
MTKVGVGKRWIPIGLWLLVFVAGWELTPRTVRIYHQWWLTRNEVAHYEQERLALLQEQADLRAQIQRLSTPLGREALARERGWLMPGEKPLQTPTQPNPEPTESSSHP